MAGSGDKQPSGSRCSPLIRLFRAHWQVLTACALTLLVLILGLTGFSSLHARRGPPSSFLDNLYQTFQLFVLQSGDVAPPVPWGLQLARFLAPLVPAWALVKTIMVLRDDRLTILRLKYWSGHVVVCGLGRRGLRRHRQSSGQNAIACRYR